MMKGVKKYEMHHSPTVHLFGIAFDLASIIMITITSIIVYIIARVATRKLSIDNPGSMQNFLEWVVEFVRNLISSTMDMKQGKVFVKLGLTLIMFIFIGNMLGLPFVVGTEVHEPIEWLGITQEALDQAHEEGKHYSIGWWKSPTASVMTTMGLATMIIVMVHYIGLRRNTKSYIMHYFEPHPAFLPLNLIKEVSKLLTLGLRLFGNIYAGEVLIGVILMAGLWGILPLIAWQGFSIFVGAIQAFVFTILTMVYISQVLPHEQEHH
jgi:F-type H+-transporting ATPase subunit a